MPKNLKVVTQEREEAFRFPLSKKQHMKHE